jgi:uncharacterized ion transporter superfamily protein YfcC
MIGGVIGIMNLTGAFDAGIAWLAKMLKGREYLLIIFTTMLMAAGGTTFGLGEETLAFYPILIPVFLAARYDVTVGVACIFMGSNIGVMCSTINPFSVIIAADAAGISWTTGLTSRVIMLGVVVVITIVYILRYAQKIRKDAIAEAELVRTERIEKAKEEASTLLSQARTTIEAEKKRALEDLRNEVADLAIRAAKVVLDAELDAEKNKKLVDNFIKDLSNN